MLLAAWAVLAAHNNAAFAACTSPVNPEATDPAIRALVVVLAQEQSPLRA